MRALRETTLLTMPQLERLLTTPTEPIALRNAAIIALLGSGLPSVQLRFLHVAHALAAIRGEPTVVRGHGGTFALRLGPRARAVLTAYLGQGRPKLARKERPELLLSPGGSPLKLLYVNRAIKRAFERAGVPLERRLRRGLARSFSVLDPVSSRSGDGEPSIHLPELLPPRAPSSDLRRENTRVRAIRELIATFKGAANGCKDCGDHIENPSLLTFDHLPGHVKRFNIADGPRHSLKAVEAEVAKCELVCCACHERRERARGR